jgi:transposase InsO family protein
MALRTRRSRQPLVYRSDRGAQYCSTYYQDIHRRHRIRCSMTDGYGCYQNALAERISRIFKGEFLLQRPANLQQATRMVEHSIYIYHHERPHMALQCKTPDAVHRALPLKYCHPISGRDIWQRVTRVPWLGQSERSAFPYLRCVRAGNAA